MIPRLRTFLLPVWYIHLLIAIWVFIAGCQGPRVETLQFIDKLPTLDQAVRLSETRYSSAPFSSEGISLSQVVMEVKRNHALILARREQLEISREVREHFEKAVTEAEKKFEEGEVEISQSAITKLKLGLAGTLNDISRFSSDMALAQLRLENYLGVQWTPSLDISGLDFQPVNFTPKTVTEYLNNSSFPAETLTETDLFQLKEAIIEINKARQQLSLAGKNRKMTRALLVTEAANYDFGIGNEADLFEALIIYTRVLVGYYEAIFSFNVSVYRFHQIAGDL